MSILEEVERFQYAPGAVFAIKLSLEEALLRVIKQGHDHNADHEVAVEATITHKWAEIAIVAEDGAGTIRIPRDGPTS